MIQVHYPDQENNTTPSAADPASVGHIVLRPNNSMTWTALKFFLFTLLTLSLCIGIAFTLQGYWMILPFTLLEMTIVCLCLYYIARRNNYQEVLRFSPDEIVIELGRQRIEQVFTWPRYFSKFLVEAPKHPWYAQRIFIRNADKRIELGRFLTQPEKQELLSEVRRLIRAADQASVG